jgi:hypothetical protein
MSEGGSKVGRLFSFEHYSVDWQGCYLDVEETDKLSPNGQGFAAVGLFIQFCLTGQLWEERGPNNLL